MQRGLFAGAGGPAGSGGAAYQAAAEAWPRAATSPSSRAASTASRAWLDPDEFRTTWVGNKAVYRTRMAVADGGELVVLAPGVTRFGEDPLIDAPDPPSRLPRHTGHARRAAPPTRSSPTTWARRPT